MAPYALPDDVRYGEERAFDAPLAGKTSVEIPRREW
jgi:hypothetical protein